MTNSQLHIFVDNSNVIGGAQDAGSIFEPQVPWPALRVYFRNLFQLIERGRPVQTAVLGGSVPPGNEQLWEYARGQGYDTDLLRRVPRDDGRLREQAVDEMIHLKMANAILDHDPPQTMVLVTGDGKESEFSTSFIKQVERALKRGWEIEVWAWQGGLSQRFELIAERENGGVKVYHLDEFYRSITFVKEGNYFTRTDGGHEIPIRLGNRIVQPLPQPLTPVPAHPRSQ